MKELEQKMWEQHPLLAESLRQIIPSNKEQATLKDVTALNELKIEVRIACCIRREKVQTVNMVFSSNFSLNSS